MSNDTNETIDDQAARWAARSLSGDFSAAEKRALEKWCAADTRHRAAFEEYATIADLSAAALRETQSERVVQFSQPKVRRRVWLAAAPAIAASVAAAAFVVNFVALRPEAVETYATRTGEVSEITLADASVVVLNTNSEIAVRYSKQERQIDLVRGEALFDVVRNPDRPFFVEASGAEARVLGTTFNVYAKPDAMTVSVLSGVVEVGAAGRRASQVAPVVLPAGGEVTVYDQGLSISDVREIAPQHVASWREGIARYENEALSEVVSDLNRYFKTKIILGDDSLNDIPVTGGFNLENQDVAVEALSVALNLRAEERAPSMIILLPYE